MSTGKLLHMVGYSLLFAGGLNWGLVGLFNFNLVALVFGGFANVVYVLVGVSALYALFTHMGECKICSGKK